MSDAEFHAIETSSRLSMENEGLRREAYKNTNAMIEKNAVIYELQDQIKELSKRFTTLLADNALLSMHEDILIQENDSLRQQIEEMTRVMMLTGG